MTREKFLEFLEKGTSDVKIKEQCCIYFLKNYPVVIIYQHSPFQAPGEILTSIGNNIIEGASSERIEDNFKKLQGRVTEIKNYYNGEK